MVRENSLWAFAVLAFFLVLLLPSVNIAANDNTFVDSVDNETIVVDYSSPVAVDPPLEPLGFEPNATVFNESGAELVNGTDFEWQPSDGTVEWFNTSSTSDGESATISYEYLARTQDTRDIGSILSIIGSVLGLLFLVGAIGATFKNGLGW